MTNTDSDYVLVPREPTEEMISAGRASDRNWFGLERARLRKLYRAMLQVAPATPTITSWHRIDDPVNPAPKDGTLFDVWIGGDISQRYTDVAWREPTPEEFWAAGSDEPDTSKGEYGPEAGFFDCHGLKLVGGLAPSHWMPTPLPPAPDEGGE